MKIGRLVAVLLITLGCCSSLWANDYDDAKKSAEDFIYQYEQLRSLKPKEVKLLVSTICDADFDDIDSVSRDISSRVKDEVNDKYDKLKSLHDETIKALEKVLKNDDLKDKQSDARDYEKRVDELWDRIERMYSDGIRGGNHPVVAFMRKMGQDSHPEYQSHSEYCTEHEVETSDGKADCVYAEKCWVVELKPNNNRAVDVGRRRAQTYAEDLNKDKDGKFSDLVKKNQAFSKCQGQFVPKVATYVACPEVDDEGNYKSTSYGWSDPRD
ncbi:MAG: hypothetical protein ACXV5R_05780 [Candidatus Angelobacter sp.]